LWTCTLAADLSAATGIADPGSARIMCAADRSFELQPGSAPQVARCTLAQPIDVLGIPCAAGGEIELGHARLIGCTLAASREFETVTFPPGSVVRFGDTRHRVEQVTLPPLPSPLRAFGMELPSATKIVLCRDRWVPDQLFVPDGAYVEIAGVRLTGVVNFDCGVLNYGALFEETRIAGETWAAGRTVFRRDLDPVSR
jgi:hypothetical protein